MADLTASEIALGELAARVVAQNGGFLTFEQYDALMYRERYSAPLSWCWGWGLPIHLLKANQDKLCAFAAVEIGLLAPVECVGYRWVAAG